MVKHSKLEREWAAGVLLGLVTDAKTRISNGKRLREKMVEQIKKGEQPTGYRPAWLRQSAHRLIAELNEITNEFNDTHHTDQASLGDLLDILATAMNLVQMAQRDLGEVSADPKHPEFLA